MRQPDVESGVSTSGDASTRPPDSTVSEPGGGGPLTAGSPPEHRMRVVIVSALAGLALAVAWSFEFVDHTIGDGVANSILAYDVRDTAITGSAMGAVFAFVTGLAGTFTACNVAAFGAVAPMVGESQSAREHLWAVARPLGWLAVGMVAVSGLYGAVGSLLGGQLPQLSTATTATGMPVRLVQSSVVFGVIGLAFVYLGLVAVGSAPDPLSRLRKRVPHADLLVIGGMIGAFLIGRPFGLFFKMFEFAAEQANPLYGAGTFILQSVGNIIVIAVLLALLIVGTRGRFQAWLTRGPGRLARFTGGGLVIAGTFTFVYWVLRVPATFGYGWFPTAPWG